MAAVVLEKEELAEARRQVLNWGNKEFKDKLAEFSRKFKDYAEDNGMMEQAYEACVKYEKVYNTTFLPYINTISADLNEYTEVAEHLEKGGVGSHSIPTVDSTGVEAPHKKANQAGL